MRRSVRTRPIAWRRARNRIPNALPIAPTTGQPATSPFATGIAGHIGRSAIAHGDHEVVGAGDGAERAGQPMGRGTRVARRRHAYGAELGERVEQATRRVSRGVERLHAAS